MKRTGKLILLAGLFAVFAAAGCNDRRHTNPDRSISLSTVDNPENSLHYFFTTDRGNRMWIASTAVRNYRPETGQRIIADFLVLGTPGEGAGYDYDVHLNRVFEVLTKDIIVITEENDAELGNDPFRDVAMWVAGDWLNVEFIIRGHNRVNFINMGQVTGEEPSEDGILNLELRRNANGDTERRNLWGIASFDLLPYRQDGVDEVPIRVHANIAGITGGRTFELTYKYNGETPTTEGEFTYREDADWADVY